MTQPLPFGEPEDIAFKRDDGTTIAAHLWRPDGFQPETTYPTLLVGGAVSMVKERAPDNYAPLFTHEGFVAVSLAFA
jgi:hypothetical protein